jgi:beta-mannanase
MQQLAGGFFDEAAPAQQNCNTFSAEYKKLHDILEKNKSWAKIAYKPGAVNGAAEGEITRFI